MKFDLFLLNITSLSFTEILKYQISERTPTGYVHLWTTSNPANFAIDNLNIINKDQDPNLIEVDYSSALLVKPEDFAYEPLKYNFAPEEDENVKGTFNHYLIIPMMAAVCVLILAVAWAIIKKKAGGEKDAKKNP